MLRRSACSAPLESNAPPASGNGTVITSSSRVSKIAFSEDGTHAVT